MTRGGFDRWRQRVLGDDSLQAQLRDCEGWEHFRDLCVRLAAEQGCSLGPSDLDAARDAGAQADLGRGQSDRRILDAIAPDGWTPVAFDASGPTVEWCDLRGLELGSESFSATVQRAATHPYRLLWRLYTAPAALADHAAGSPPLPVAGLIFHTSRCGSTLVCRMLAQLAGTVVFAEPPVIDEILRAPLGEEQRRRYLEGVVAALARRRTPGQRRVIIKLDSWSTRDLSAIRSVLPGTPWVFLYRDPASVVASQLRLPGMPGAPGVLAPELFGMDLAQALEMPREAYCARVLGAVCEDALDHLDATGLPVNYDSLPDAVTQEILPHFELLARGAETDRMRAVALQDAKRPYQRFDRHASTPATTAGLRTACDRWASGAFAELEQVRTARIRPARAMC